MQQKLNQSVAILKVIKNKIKTEEKPQRGEMKVK